MENIEYANLTDKLLSSVPELKERYERELSRWQGPGQPGQYIVFGFVVKPSVRVLLASDQEAALLKRIFDFFEQMARSPDIQVPNLLGVEIFEWLVGDPTSLATAWKYMGDATKQIACATARWSKREQNIPRANTISWAFLTNRISPATFGILAIIFFAAYWLLATTPNLFQPDGRFGPIVVPTGIAVLTGSFVAGLIAGIRGSKWWFLTLLGPAIGLIQIWSSRI